MTNRLVLKSVEQQMADYKPVYNPIYPLFLGNGQSYSQEVGQLTFKRLDAVRDIRGKHITPKDTEIRQIGVKESSKVFKKYFLANQFVQSNLQDQSNVDQVVKQVLDEHQKQMDDLLLLGEGTQDSDVVNNGLFFSGDTNHVTEASEELDTDGDPCISMHTQLMLNVLDAKQIAGRKLIIFYGANVLAQFNSLYAASNTAFKAALAGVLGAGWAFAEMPSDVTPANVDGWIIANLDQTKLHYTAIPQLKDQGVNSEKMYTWHNFLMGSCMLDVLQSGAVIRQPVTFEA